jgi:membrane-associated phospholipid phosphatase
VISLAVFPVICPLNFYGFSPTLDMTRFTVQFTGLRAGTFTVIRFDDLEGLVSMPSFHAAAGLMVTWCFRRYRPWVIGLSCLNALMILATFMSGAHYFIDVVGTFVLFPVSVLLYRRWVAPLLG